MNTPASTDDKNSAVAETETLAAPRPVPDMSSSFPANNRRLFTDSAAEAVTQAVAPDVGFVDYYGFVGSLSGWFFCGWIARADGAVDTLTADFVAKFEEGELLGKATVAHFPRYGIKDKGRGVLIFVQLEASAHWVLRQLSIFFAGAELKANGGFHSKKLGAADLATQLRPIIQDLLEEGPVRSALRALLSRVYLGEDTLASLDPLVRLEIDKAILCPPDGLILIGWRLLTPGVVKRIRAGSGACSVDVRFEQGLPIARHDVASSVLNINAAFEDARCGFAVYLPHCLQHGEPPFLEVETCTGEVLTRPIRLSSVAGIEAIKLLLADVEVHFDELDIAFDHVLGPAVSSLNTYRLSAPVRSTIVEFGAAPEHPRCSVIVPLFGRMDFLEYQMAFFSVHRNHGDVEFIYVLDDPVRRRELENLAHSVYARFEIPFRLLLLPQNLGFGPANNHGLRLARADYVCFLNSDAFPGTPDWIERLTTRLARNTNIGVIGPRLLYEDGSVQHEGCIYSPLKAFGGWMYVDHDNRGRRPGPEHGLRIVPAITGACMMMHRRLAEELGGFDEAFIIGDFEDSDLCKKVSLRGLTCAVDRDVHLYHLERKSQAASVQRWRQNLTLYNAWVHQRRWYPTQSSS